MDCGQNKISNSRHSLAAETALGSALNPSDSVLGNRWREGGFCRDQNP